MNIVNDGVYTYDNPSLLTKTKKVVKMAIKGTAYTAFLGIAVASALHLYNNPEDRASVAKGLKTIGVGIEAKVNDSVYKLTGHTLGHYIGQSQKVADYATHDIIEKAKEMTPEKKDGEKIMKNVEKAGVLLSEGVKKEAPGIADTIKKDAAGSVEKAKDDVKHQIKQIRQYSGDLTQRLANSVKP